MALKKDFVFQGILVKEAYHKVTSTEADKKQIIANISIYSNQESADMQEGFLQTLTFIFEHDLSAESQNVIKQCYNNLKSTEMYAGAIDV